ncbi:MAG: hypothetical protein QM736_16510 [Vicinamibacterales bacterium]
MVISVALLLMLFAVGCAGQGSAEQMNAPVSIGTKNTSLLIENRAGQTLSDVHLTVVPFGKNEYSKALSTLGVDERREVPLSDLTAADGSKFIPMLSKPKTVRVTAKDATGKQYDIELPWR